MALWLAGITYAYTKLPKFETVTEHHVRVWSEIDGNKWYMTSDEHPKGFVYQGCDDFPNRKVIWAGYIADYARWEEQGACKSIRRPDLEFHWDRDESHNVRRIN